MPRQWKEKVRGFPELIEGRSYPVRVTHIAKATGPPTRFEVRGEHLSAEQSGRELEFALDYPIRPKGLTAEFFRAAGLDVALDKAVYPKKVIDRIVIVCFEAGDGNSPIVKSFKPQTPEEFHDASEYQPGPVSAPK